MKGFKAYNLLMPVTCKTSKRTLLIPGHSTYSAKQWGAVLGRQLLLSDWACSRAIISDCDAKFTSDY
ncbi:hypothetical protein M406DRAFT_264434 [Cryphonectria parasitica EP155]|uniref:Uncharacterized protein n=1 Tax=Cryphonectria parasitica (strain ATCC 38755 / EP155) TaxID=660469 RepID=A0A9P4XYG8_CRYP1|nr:uncharacterized protein M406DRAFT_264434 [Cryphonectria parasitica EP155]KAF3762855.1 hypothetical protein M406DRAFT_264434 [Cryphonectria parasitica EP155]